MVSPASSIPSDKQRTYEQLIDALEVLFVFDLEEFSSRGEFLAKVHTYQLYFNLARPNSHKENLTPWQIIERLAPRSPLETCLLPPVFLDYYLNDARGIRCAQASLAPLAHEDSLRRPNTLAAAPAARLGKHAPQ